MVKTSKPRNTDTVIKRQTSCTKASESEIILDIVVHVIVAFVIIATFYPFLYILSMSVSNPGAVLAGKVTLFPIGFELGAYKIIVQNSEIWMKFRNTIWVVAVGTALNVIITILAAYPLSRKEMPFKGFFSLCITFTMFFSGGMIPTYILIKNLGLINSLWSLVLPVAANAFYIIIARTYIKSLPESLIESAKLDGCKHIGILFKIILPLSLPIIAVVVLYGAVNHWNTYFSALIYITESKLQPLQLYLVRVLVSNDQNLMLRETEQFTTINEVKSYQEQLKYAIIIFSVLPIIGAYPLLQRYFVKGLLIGSIKG